MGAHVRRPPPTWLHHDMPHGYVAEVDLLDLDAWELERLVRARQIFGTSLGHAHILTHRHPTVNAAARSGTRHLRTSPAPVTQAVLVGLVLNACSGWWWADPLGRYVLLYDAIREARESLSKRRITMPHPCRTAPPSRCEFRGSPQHPQSFGSFGEVERRHT